MPDTPARPERTRRAPDHARPRLDRDRRGTLSTTTRTCNTVAHVYMFTRRAMIEANPSTLANIERWSSQSSASRGAPGRCACRSPMRRGHCGSGSATALPSRLVELSSPL